MSALSRSLDIMDARVQYLPEMHVHTAIRRGGEAILRRNIVFIWAPYDPIDADNSHTIYVLFFGGDVLTLASIIDELIAQGYTHTIWTRDLKGGSPSLQKHSLQECSRLIRLLTPKP